MAQKLHLIQFLLLEEIVLSIEHVPQISFVNLSVIYTNAETPLSELVPPPYIHHQRPSEGILNCETSLPKYHPISGPDSFRL